MARKRHAPRIGLALGGGAARGFAHIPVLQALDELGLKPAVIAGTSMGAVIGAAYAAGMSGADIDAYATGIFRNRSDFFGRLWQLRPRRLSEISFGIGQLDLERVLSAFLPDVLPDEFAGLTIPLRVTATDYYAGEVAVFADGPLLPAIAASAAIPMVFRPVTINGRIMVDGGIRNPVPFDLLGDVEIVIAVDVLGEFVGNPERVPGALESVFGATQLLMRAITTEKLKHGRPPDILLRPPTGAFNILDFTRAAAIIKAGEPAKEEIRRQLGALLAH
jgi:NTE family protein